jgi:hypothetical protein
VRDGTRQATWALLAVVGVVAVGLALLPGAAALVPVEAAVDLVGNDYFLLGLFGGVALAVLGWMLGRRASEQVEQASPPDPETVPDAPRPGAGFDDLLGRWAGGLDGEERTRLRERLRTDAVYREMATGVDRATARERVEAGEWTDDPVAARFLAGEGPSILERLRLAFRGDGWTQHGARAAAAVLTDEGGDQ